ncbi:VTC domain-containing protein, partial [Clostridium sp.]|uniref:VTC domain-containing protein n=1 Tax=Clostridium sp. TaxID=1506 RepID=UPI003F3D596E
DYINNQVINEISTYLSNNKVTPKVYIGYSRKAFFAKNDKTFRVTFDNNIIARRDYLTLQDGLFGYPILKEGFYLMEVKILGSIPLWFTSILSNLSIYNTHYSKYGNEFMQYCLNKEESYNKGREEVC